MSGMPDRTHAGVSVWWLDPQDLPTRALALLSPEERERVDARPDSRGAERLAAASVLLRCAVASLTGRRPQEVTVCRRCPRCAAPHGRPQLRDSSLRVSVSHAGRRVAVAVSARDEVGVDVEVPRARGLSRALLRRALSSDEAEYLFNLSEDRRMRTFLRAWTAKEAILKATGQGLHGGPHQLDLELRCTPVRLRSWAGSAARASRVRLFELDPGGDHVATLATIGCLADSVAHREGRPLLERMIS
jgi:4'-phosphopantetheinyl transferase